MDIKVRPEQVIEAYKVLKRVGVPIRIPTARWLLSDCLDVIDCVTNEIMGKLIKAGVLKKTSGGWLELTSTKRVESPEQVKL